MLIVLNRGGCNRARCREDIVGHVARLVASPWIGHQLRTSSMMPNTYMYMTVCVVVAVVRYWRVCDVLVDAKHRILEVWNHVYVWCWIHTVATIVSNMWHDAQHVYEHGRVCGGCGGAVLACV
jgi:hypothetical protein